MTELRGVGRASRSRAAALLLVVLGVLVGGCQTISSPGSVAGAPTAPAVSAPRPAADTPVAATAAQDTVVLASRGDSISLNPLLNIDNASRNVWQNIFEPLVKPDPLTGAPAPALAERFDQSADGLTYTFSIRPNVLWSDGQPLTADDAKFTFEAALDPRTNSPWRTRLGLVERVEASDAQTFRVVLKSPLCPFLIDGMGLPILPKHVLAGPADLSTDAFNSSRPVGTGPYIFKEWARDDHLANTAVDGLLEQGRAVQGCDQAVRKPIYDAIQQQIAQDQPYTFLWGQQTSVVYNKRLQNLAPNYWADAAGAAYDGIQKWIIAR